jgi:hypothetical protein
MSLIWLCSTSTSTSTMGSHESALAVLDLEGMEAEF